MAQAPTRYAVHQVLDHELQKAIVVRETAARRARFKAGSNGEDYSFDDKENLGSRAKPAALPPKIAIGAAKKDFFGRVIADAPRPLREAQANAENRRTELDRAARTKVWVTFNEGLNNAVTKPISLDEFLAGL